MFVGNISIPEGVFVGDEIYSMELTSGFEAVIFGETQAFAENLLVRFLGPSLSDTTIGVRDDVTPIQECISVGDLAEFRTNDVLSEVHIAKRIVHPVTIRSGIYHQKADTSYLWLCIAEGEKVRTFTMECDADTSGWTIVNKINSLL